MRPSDFSIEWIYVIILLLGSTALVNGQSLFRRESSPFKGFSGVRVRNDSLRQVYYYDQTVAVVELGPGTTLLNCELIEVYKPEVAKGALDSLSFISKPITISFSEMNLLMEKCEEFESPEKTPEDKVVNRVEPKGRSIGGFSVFSGILPGTKWCGVGNIADTYYDLGPDTAMDKCCRTHDICPIKIQAYDSRYNLTNNAFYTKTHCTCDQKMYECLKASKNPTADSMGKFYFNILRIPCIEDVSPNLCNGPDCVKYGPSVIDSRRFRKTRQRY